jgi:hypothetical protein
MVRLNGSLEGKDSGNYQYESKVPPGEGAEAGNVTLLPLGEDLGAADR